MLSVMSNTAGSLAIPNDLKACQTLVEELAQQLVAQHHTIDSQAHLIESHADTINALQHKHEQLEKEKLELELAYTELLQRAFLKRRERYIADPDQLRIDFGDSDEAADAAEGLAQAVEEAELIVAQHTRKRRARKPRTERLPAHLPRYEVEAQVSDDVRLCPQHGPRKVIAYDYTETLEFERPKLRVRVTKYPKFACEQEPQCGIASPERPTSLVEGDRYDTSVAAEVITGKYGYHLPIYRQQDYFAGSGWLPARSTLLNLLVAAAFVIRPLIAAFRQAVLGDSVVGTDDTRTTLLLPKNIPPRIEGDAKSWRIHEVFQEAIEEGKSSVSARMWAYRGVTVPLCVFDFTVSHHRDGPDAFLEHYTGKLMADCYSGYQGISLRSNGLIQRGACVTHARRKVLDGQDGYPLESSILLAKFQQLYAVETRAKTYSPEERWALRQSEAVPVWESMRVWLDSEAAARVLPKSKLGQALGYLRNHGDALRLYLSDGIMPIDNNDVEQLMKQIALGRKNWVFIGSVAAGERAADFFTLVSSAVRNDLDVWMYTKDVLDQLLAGSTDYHALRPDVWKQSHPEAVREYRAEERRDRADRTRLRRAQRLVDSVSTD
jgi:transposase